MAEPLPRSIMVAGVAQESKWSLFHQLGSHGEGRVPRPPVQGDSLRASEPYGHNTLTGLYSTPYSFNQSKAHILSSSLHVFFVLFSLKMYQPPLMYSMVLLLWYLCILKKAIQLFVKKNYRKMLLIRLKNINILYQCISLLSSPRSRNCRWMFKHGCIF